MRRPQSSPASGARAAPARVEQSSAAEPNVQRLVDSCQGLVRSLAWKIHQKLPPHVDLEDLIAFGQLGLVEAARGFDPERGGKFITYAYYRIRGAVFDGLSKMRWFSHHDYHNSRYARVAGDVLESTDAGAAEDDAYADARWFSGVTGSLAIAYLAIGGDRDDEGASPFLVDTSASLPPEEAIERELRENLRELIAALPADAGSLIRSVYYEGLTLKEAGERLGISKAWASRLHAKTLKRLGRALELLEVAD